MLPTKLCCLPVLLLLAISFSGHAAPLIGEARVVDGDTLVIGTRTLDLFAVDAPELAQTCSRGGKDWPCGRVAADKLRELVAGRATRCLLQAATGSASVQGVCTTDGVDLAAALVSAGLALAGEHDTGRYIDQEAGAWAQRRGMWAGQFTEPWKWRRERDRPKPPPGFGEEQ